MSESDWMAWTHRVDHAETRTEGDWIDNLSMVGAFVALLLLLPVLLLWLGVVALARGIAELTGPVWR